VAGAQAVATLGEAPTQADVGARAVRRGHAAPVDRQRLRQAAGDADDERRVRARPDRRHAHGGGRAGSGDRQRDDDGDDDGSEQGGAHPAAG
jgi:hypothetical protein